MNPIEVEEMDDFPANDIPLRKNNSLGDNNLAIETDDLEFDTNQSP
tara:strand:+ start:1227 stop:1364 length:138 start_codon:yes stop_codon:yes gene_type:complete